MIETVAIISIIYMLAIFIFIVGRFFTYQRKGRIRFFKNFKKGKFALIYIASIPLYAATFYSGGYNAGGAFLKSIRSTIELIVLKFDYDSVKDIMAQNLAFRIAMIMCFSLVTLNAAMFTFSVCGRAATNAVCLLYTRFFGKNVVVVIGNNKHSHAIVDSADDGKTRLILMGVPDENGKDEMFAFRRAFVSLKEDENAGRKLASLLPPIDTIKVTVVVNTQNDRLNLNYCKDLSDLIGANQLNRLFFDAEEGLEVFVFSEPANESSFACVEHSSSGRIHHVNKYRMIATDFLSKHPFAAYMDENYIDYDNAAVRDDVEVNAVMIGFGKTNHQLFLDSVSGNTMMRINEKGNYVPKPVNYFIFDKEESENEKNLNHAYFKFVNSYDRLVRHKDEYLPLPPLPANCRFFRRDVNSQRFYDEVRECLCSGKKNIGFVIIAYSDDLSNVDLALKTCENVKEWNLDFPVYVFVKIRDNKLNRKIAGREMFRDHMIIPFGAEKELVYDFANITNRRFEKLAKASHLVYSATYNIDQKGIKTIEELKRLASDEWFDYFNVQRVSNVHACLSIKAKLNLAGYDVAPASSPMQDVTDEFIKKYEKGNLIRRLQTEFDGLHPAVYDNAMLELKGLRRNFADLEHARWNAFMCAAGFLPATIYEIKVLSKEERFIRRIHANITTREGLIRYRGIAAEISGMTEEDKDVIRYDYRLMDDVAWLLHGHGYKIVRKPSPPDWQLKIFVPSKQLLSDEVKDGTKDKLGKKETDQK